jgi:peroxiredoxin
MPTPVNTPPIASRLPEGLPAPQDDGACSHLVGRPLPPVILRASSGARIDMSRLEGLAVIYIYPISGDDDSLLPDDWDAIPGARGCTPQSCSYRDHQHELSALGARVFGLATQSPEYLRREAERLHLPYPLLSDESLAFQQALSLPLFDVRVAGAPVLKRVTLICQAARIIHVFYPVFPPDQNAEQVVTWLRLSTAGDRT